MSKIKKILSFRSGAILFGILNLIDLLQIIPFYPRFETQISFLQYPYIMFPLKILVFIIGVPIFLLKSMKFIKKIEMSYGKSSITTTLINIAKFTLYLVNGVGNVVFLYVIASNTIEILKVI